MWCKNTVPSQKLKKNMKWKTLTLIAVLCLILILLLCCDYTEARQRRGRIRGRFKRPPRLDFHRIFDYFYIFFCEIVDCSVQVRVIIVLSDCARSNRGQSPSRTQISTSRRSPKTEASSCWLTWSLSTTSRQDAAIFHVVLSEEGKWTK